MRSNYLQFQQGTGAFGDAAVILLIAGDQPELPGCAVAEPAQEGSQVLLQLHFKSLCGLFLHFGLDELREEYDDIEPEMQEEAAEALEVELEEDLAALLRRFRDCAIREPRLVTRYQEDDGSITESSGSLLEL